MKLIAFVLAAFAVAANGQRQDRIKGQVDMTERNHEVSSSSFRALKKSKDKDAATSTSATCSFAPLPSEETTGYVMQMGGQISACVKSSDKYCGEKFRLLPPGSNMTCNPDDEEVQVDLSTEGEYD